MRDFILKRLELLPKPRPAGVAAHTAEAEAAAGARYRPSEHNNALFGCSRAAVLVDFCRRQLNPATRMKVTLITGTSAGIGEAFARRLAADQYDLLLVARSESKLQTLCAELTARRSITARYVALDLAAPAADQTLWDETQRRGLEVDWRINNAGIGSGGDFLEYDLPGIPNLLHLHMDAMVALTHRFRLAAGLLPPLLRPAYPPAKPPAARC